MCAIRFWDSFSTSNLNKSPKELELICDIELLARLSFLKLVMFTKSLASMLWMWFSARSLKDDGDYGRRQFPEERINCTHSKVISEAISFKANCFIEVIRFFGVPTHFIRNPGPLISAPDSFFVQNSGKIVE